MIRACGCGTASSAEFSIASNGTLMEAAHFGPSALESSTDHCDSHARRVEKRPIPTGPVLAVSGLPMKVQRGLRSFGSMAGSMKRGSHSVRYVTKPRSISSVFLFFSFSSVSFTQAVRFRIRDSCAPLNRVTNSLEYGGWFGHCGL